MDGKDNEARVDHKPLVCDYWNITTVFISAGRKKTLAIEYTILIYHKDIK